MAKKKSLSGTLRRAGVKKKVKPKKPFWKGPEIDGITQSMLSKFLVCKERFRLSTIEGLHTQEGFNKALEYGNMWHCCEEEYSRSKGNTDKWSKALLGYTKSLCVDYPLQREEIVKWYNVCKMQFEVYLDYWKKNAPKKKIKEIQIAEEGVFDVPYKLPSGRTVRLRGMSDGVVLRGTGRDKGLYVREHKTKGDIKEEQLKRQLQFDLQTTTYLIALQTWFETDPNYNGDKIPFRGVLYNVVRRPLAGGKGSIRQHKPTKSNPQGESKEEYYTRLKQVIEDEANIFFMRWTVTITEKEIQRFKTDFLNPTLEHLCDWWEWIKVDPFNPWRKGNQIHYRTPFGIYNPLTEAGCTDIDAYLLTGNEVGLERSNQLFRELKK